MGMSTSYVPYHPEQQHLLPNALQDWLPEGHLAYCIGDTVDSLDLSAFHARYAKEGPRNQPFHAAIMIKVLVYAYATGTFSSRKIGKKLFEDVAFRVLAADNFPAHRTIRDFRALHLGEFTELFTQVVRLAREMGLIKLGTIAIDGTKANASRHKAMSHGRMQTTEVDLKAQIAALLQKASLQRYRALALVGQLTRFDPEPPFKNVLGIVPVTPSHLSIPGADPATELR